MARLSAFAETNLNRQGFEKLDKDAKARIALPLRFTPAVGTTLIVIGLIFQSPIWLGSMALVALSGALLPDAMIIDLAYNFSVRHLVHAPALPSTPRPRQFSYLLSTVLLSGSAVSFHYGLSVLGLVAGGLVVAGGTILTTTLWCLGSWYYRMIFRASSYSAEGSQLWVQAQCLCGLFSRVSRSRSSASISAARQRIRFSSGPSSSSPCLQARSLPYSTSLDAESHSTRHMKTLWPFAGGKYSGPRCTVPPETASASLRVQLWRPSGVFPHGPIFPSSTS